ncbi:hypothetical protein NBE98_09495 [Clostridium swellfunianum]|nr:hypothetical protein [Clostridium swellfunianum]MCM0648606.1 hypothetical protein [Clostridium swellfunianum]
MSINVECINEIRDKIFEYERLFEIGIELYNDRKDEEKIKTRFWSYI